MTDSMEKILEIVSKDCLMPSTDFKDAYFVVSIASDLTKFLRLFCEEKLYQFCCLPFGLPPALIVFTKIMRPPTSDFRRIGH